VNFGYVVYLEIVLRLAFWSPKSRSSPAFEIQFGFLFFGLRKLEEGLSKRKLTINLFLGESKVFNVEKPDVVYSMLELLSKTLFAAWSNVVLQIKSYQFRPRQIGLGL
jgi:hypothetical protein